MLEEKVAQIYSKVDLSFTKVAQKLDIVVLT